MKDAPTALASLRLDRDDEPDPPSRFRWVLGLVLLVLAAAAAAVLLTRPLPVPTVPARSPDPSRSRILLNASGYVTARREATVSSKVTGKVTEVLLEEGLQVEAGQTLARLDDTNAQAALALAEALLASARAALTEIQVRLDEAQRQLRRTSALVTGRIATEADLDRAEAEVRSLEARLTKLAADVTVAERELALRRQDLEDTIIRAPFAGVVTTKNAQPGEMISPISAGGGFTRTGICTLVDMSSLEIEVDVNESFIQRVSPGQSVEATLDAYTDWTIPGHVLAVIPAADRQKATVKVRIGFQQLDPRILPDMAVRVAFLGEPTPQDSPGGVLIPASALAEADGLSFVWLIQDGRAVRRPVTPGPRLQEEITIRQGLQPGDRVVTDALPRLREGRRLRETSPAPPRPTPSPR